MLFDRFFYHVFIVVFSILGAMAPAQAQLVALSEKAEVTLLTVSEGDALYSAFGHTGLRFRDEEQGLDVVFNYGTFDFNTPGFYLKFMRGQLDYMLAVESYENFISTYRDLEKRGVKEQVLNLTSVQKERLFGLVKENFRPENRYYRYDFFFDNCATKPRDVFEKAFGKDLIWGNSPNPKKTFRVLLDESLRDKRWAKFGIDLILGQKTDRVATKREVMFLPEYLRWALGNAKIVQNGSLQPFVASEKVLIEVPNRPASPDWPTWLAWLLFLVILFASVRASKMPVLKRFLSWFDLSLFAIYGFTGWVIIGLWFFTDHKVTPENWNIVWLLPSHLLAAFLGLFRRWKKHKMRYMQVNGFIILLFLVMLPFIQQSLNPAFIPLIILIGLRSFFQWLDARPQSQTKENLLL